MSKSAIFAQITKVDEAKRLVHGRAAQQVIDNSGEVFDYATSRPYFEKWSTAIQKASDGKSMGNVRSMHGQVAAGKIVDMAFNDAECAIDVVAKVVDDNEWRKVLEGVHTGFSIGGSYVKKWQDPGAADVTRYTANPSEISLVDRPCIPTATFFEVHKADGQVEKIDFKSQPTADADDPTFNVVGTDEEVAALTKMLNDNNLSVGDVVQVLAKDLKARADAEELAKRTPVFALPEKHLLVLDTPAQIEAAYAYVHLPSFAKAVGDADLAKAKEAVTAAWNAAFPEQAPPADAAAVASHVAKVLAVRLEAIEGLDLADDLAKLFTPPAAALPANEDALAKALSAIEVSTATIDTLSKRVAALEAQPAPARVVLRAVAKGEDVDLNKRDGDDVVPVAPLVPDADRIEVATSIKRLHKSGGTPAFMKAT